MWWWCWHKENFLYLFLGIELGWLKQSFIGIHISLRILISLGSIPRPHFSVRGKEELILNYSSLQSAILGVSDCKLGFLNAVAVNALINYIYFT